MKKKTLEKKILIDEGDIEREDIEENIEEEKDIEGKNCQVSTVRTRFCDK